MTTHFANLKSLYTFQGQFTFDLHDLAAIILRERQLSDSRFNRARLLEVVEGESSTAGLPNVAQAIWASIPVANKTAFSLGLEAKPFGDLEKDGPLELDEFFDPELRMPPGRAPYTEIEKEMVYWRIRHHDSGYILCEALQQVLDALPEDRTRLRIRTSQGYAIPECSPKTFHIAEIALMPKRCTHTSVAQPLLQYDPPRVTIEQHLFGHDLQPVPWVYLLFGGESVANVETVKDGRVMLDLVSPLAGMRGLGGELFSMERLVDFHERILQTGGEEVINYNDPRSIEYDGCFLSGRIQNDSTPEVRPIVQDLATRVLRRLSRIASGEEAYCAYCGKKDATFRCSKCKKSMYCGGTCQTRAWKYHKKWCNLDVDRVHS